MALQGDGTTLTATAGSKLSISALDGSCDDGVAGKGSHYAPSLAAAAQMLSNVGLLAAIPGSLTLVLPADPCTARLRCCMATLRVSQPGWTYEHQLVTSCDLIMSASF